MKEELREMAKDVLLGVTLAPPDTEFESAIIIGAKSPELLDGITRKIKMYLSTNGQYIEEVNSIEEGIDIKRLATTAGLGIIGKSTLVITPEYGARARFSIILTDTFIEADKQREFDFCKGCTICIEACPAGAISDSGHNKSACEHHMGNVCVICMEACPVGD